MGQEKRRRPQGKAPATEKSKRPRRSKVDEEIDSDVELASDAQDGDDNHEAESGTEEEDDFFEEPDAKRLRMAKKYLSDIGAGKRPEEEVAEDLEREANIQARRLHYRVADVLKHSEPRLLRGHKRPPTCVAMSRANEEVAYSGGKDCAVIRWNLETGQKDVFPGGAREFTCGGHFAPVMDICVTPDGRTLCSVGEDRLVRLWDTRKSRSKCLTQLQGHTKAITGVCCDTEDRIYTVSQDMSVKVWSVATQSCQDTLYGHTRSGLAIDVLEPDRPATGGEDGTVRFWKASNDTHLLFQHSQREPVDTVCVMSRQVVAAGSQDGSVAVWSTTNRHPISLIPNAHGGNWITSLATIPYSDVLFSGSDDGFIRLWKVERPDIEGTGRVLKMSGSAKRKLKCQTAILGEIPLTGVVTSMTVAPTGRALVAAVGKEHKRGRWVNIKEARNGLFVVPLEGGPQEDDS